MAASKKKKTKKDLKINWTVIKDPKFELTFDKDEYKTITLQAEFMTIYSELSQLSQLVKSQYEQLQTQEVDIVGLQGRATAANEEITELVSQVGIQQKTIDRLTAGTLNAKLGIPVR